MHTNNIISGTPQAHIPQARQAQHRREDTSGAIPAFVPDGGFALSGLRDPPVSPYTVDPASAAPPGDDHRHGVAMPGGGSRLARHTVRATCR
ncbi:hypothetical protein M3O75_28815 [Klebsiella pneumoniae]|nr:hypothetical protein [Klebsiella pneumoniae]